MRDPKPSLAVLVPAPPCDLVVAPTGTFFDRPSPYDALAALAETLREQRRQRRARMRFAASVAVTAGIALAGCGDYDVDVIDETKAATYAQARK